MALSAAEELAKDGVEAQIVDLRSLVPLDTATIRDAVASTGRALVLHEAPLTGGFGAEIAASIQEECFYDLLAPIARVTAPDTPYPLAGIEDFYVPSKQQVVDAAQALMAVAP